jgi:hypothetical protein
MRCPTCGFESKTEAALFCASCGKPLGTSPENILVSATSEPVAVSSSATSQINSTEPPIGNGTGKSDFGLGKWQPLVSAVLAVILYLTIADAAVESFIRESPERWYIAATAILYLGGCAALWRFKPVIWGRWSWANQAATSFLVLLALLATTAWLPDGLDQGLSLLGQPTSTALAILSAAVVAICGLLLARLPFVPLAVKIAVGLLSAYGVAAFLLAVKFGTPYAALFHGGGVWMKLPFWLQGSFLGGLFVIPVAMVLELVTGLKHMTRDRVPGFAAKVSALAMGLAIAVAAVRVPVDVATASADSPGETPAESPRSQDETGYTQANENLDRFYAGIDVLNNRIDRSDFELDALQARLGSDPSALLHFVRDAIRYEPYAGVLRGAVGTLISRAGNALDRSLLLVKLLQQAGFQAQIVGGQLDRQKAQALVGRLFDPEHAAREGAAPDPSLSNEIAQALGIEPQQISQRFDQLGRRNVARENDVLEYVRKESVFLSSAMAAAGINTGAAALPDRLIAEASDHYWVQYQDTDGRWVDLDSAFADAELGKTYARSATTFSPESIPEEYYHHLRITLTLRVASLAAGDGSSADTVLVDQELRAANQLSQSIVVANNPVQFSDANGSQSSAAGSAADVNGYQAVLRIGDQTTLGKYFDLNGQVSDQAGQSSGGPAAGPGGLGGGLSGLGGALDGAATGDTSEVTHTRIVGEWVTYHLTSPDVQGRPPSAQDFRRDIILSPGTRSSSSGSPAVDEIRQRLQWSDEVLLVTGRVSPNYLTYCRLKSLLDNKPTVQSLIKFAYEPTEGTAPSDSGSAPPLLGLALAAATDQGTADLLGRRFPNARRYFDSPGLIAHEFGCSASSGKCIPGESLDVVTHAPRVVVLPQSDGSSRGDAAGFAHLTEGILATRLEWALLRDNRPASEPVIRNTTEIFRAAREQNIAFTTVHSGEAGQRILASLAMPASVTAELSVSLAAGHTLIIPAKPVMYEGEAQIAWWQFNETSGELIGVLPGGRGQSLTEYAIMIGKNALGVMSGLAICPWALLHSSKIKCRLTVCAISAFGGYLIGYFMEGGLALSAFGEAAAIPQASGIWISMISAIFIDNLICGEDTAPPPGGGGGGRASLKWPRDRFSDRQFAVIGPLSRLREKSETVDHLARCGPRTKRLVDFIA